MTVSTLSNLLIVIGVVWIIAGYFSYMQTIKTNRIVKELGEKAERLYTGRNAGFMRTRRIVFAAATPAGKIVDARTLKAAIIFKPSKVIAFDEIVGKNLGSLKSANLNLEPVQEKALDNLLKDYKNRNKK